MAAYHRFKSRMLRVPRGKAVSATALADALDIPVSAIVALADAGYLWVAERAPVHPKSNIDRISIIKRPPKRIVDRASIMLWLLNLDDSQYIRDKNGHNARRMPDFSVYIEQEIMRIAKLPDPQKTEQAVRLLLRYRDAETIAAAVMRSNQPTVENIERLRRSESLKRRAETVAAITAMSAYWKRRRKAIEDGTWGKESEDDIPIKPVRPQSIVVSRPAHQPTRPARQPRYSVSDKQIPPQYLYLRPRPASGITPRA